MLVFIERHHTATAHDLKSHGHFFHVMSGESDSLILTPFINSFRVALQHQLLHGEPVTITETSITFLLHKEQTQIFLYVFPILLFKVLCYHRRIRRLPAIILWLIRKKSGQIPGKSISKISLVFFMSFL